MLEIIVKGFEMHLEKYSFGVGDRFIHQGKAQLNAMIKAKQAGIDIVPVWNKSHREHSIIHTLRFIRRFFKFLYR